MGTESTAAGNATAAPSYPLLFRPLRIGPLEIRNRVVFAGHGSRFVDWHSHHLTERQGHYLWMSRQPGSEPTTSPCCSAGFGASPPDRNSAWS